ncbi:MAG: Ig-like domain-containing protein, partial [Methanobacterium sp.]|nr:Ig-like domain-containing protein [Methanobacterium sp.]
LLVNGPLPGTAGDLPPEVEWEKVSYILNKYNPSNQNEAAAIQCAIWYFTSVHYGDYNPSAPVGTYYQYMTAPRDGVIRNWWGDDTTVRTRAWNIINQVNAATIPNYPNSVTLTPETTTVANGQTVTVTATVKDKNGNPLSGITVNFQTTAGTLSNSSGTTNANGQVTTTLTLGNNSNSVVTASVTGNYGNLLYDDQHAAVRKQNLVARNVLPLVISDFSTIKTARTANVALTQTANSPVNVGDTVTYTVTATNNGPNTATGILISDIVPAGLSGVTVTPSVGTYYNGIWTIPTLANNAKATLTITGTATAAMAGLNTTNTATRIAQEQYNSRPTTTTASVYTKKADVTITNTANHSTLNVGDNGTFTIRVTNNGPDRANIQITDLLSQLPAGFTAGTPSTGSYNPTTGVWTITNLATGTANAATLVFSGVIQAAQAGTTIINHVTATMTEYPQTVAIPDASIYVKKADVTLSQTGSYYQDTVTFIVTASNNGPDTATNIKISDVIPAGLTNVTFTPSAGTSYANGVWTIPSLDYLANATLKITGTATPQTTVINTANKTSQTEYNANMQNSTSFGVYVPQADLRIYVYDMNGLQNWFYGSSPEYIIDVKNYGPDDATGVIVTIDLGNKLQYIGYNSRSGGTVTINGNILTWNIGTISRTGNPNKPGTASIELLCRIIGTGDVTLHANVTGNEYDPNLANNAGQWDISIEKSADVKVTQTVDNPSPNIGDTITFTITVTNNGGPDDATNIEITDQIPSNLTNVTITASNGIETYNTATGVWTITSLPVNTTETLTITGKTTTTFFNNTATKTKQSDQYDWDLTNNSQIIYVPSEDQLNRSNKSTDLRIYVYDMNGLQNWFYGSSPEYIIDVKNYGPDDATGVIVTIDLGNKLQYIGYNSRSGGTVTINGNILTWNIGTISRTGNPNKPGTASIELLCRIIGTGDVTLHANVTGNEYDPNLANNAGQWDISIEKSADVKVTQTVDNPSPNIGDTITFTITVTNNGGPDDATNIEITDQIPSNLTNVTITASNGIETYNTATGVWTITSLPVNTTETLTITGKTTTTFFNNTATKTKQSDQYDWDLTNNSQIIYIIPMERVL